MSLFIEFPAWAVAHYIRFSYPGRPSDTAFKNGNAAIVRGGSHGDAGLLERMRMAVGMEA